MVTRECQFAHISKLKCLERSGFLVRFYVKIQVNRLNRLKLAIFGSDVLGSGVQISKLADHTVFNEQSNTIGQFSNLNTRRPLQGINNQSLRFPESVVDSNASGKFCQFQNLPI